MGGGVGEKYSKKGGGGEKETEGEECMMPGYTIPCKEGIRPRLESSWI